MYNCIFSGHCTNSMCDKSCPTLAETTYLLERNNINMSSEVFRSDKHTIDRYYDMLKENEGKLTTIISSDTVKTADLITYCGICHKWKGSRLHCTVYNLRYSQYVDSIRSSWSTNVESEELEYMRIWSHTASILVISNLDYVNFRDFECQTLLSLIQDRSSKNLTTVVVTPNTSSLVGKSPFFGTLTSLLMKGVNDR